MKKWFNIFLFTCTGALMFSSCKKDETRTVASASGTTPMLTASNTSLVLDKDHAADNAVTFTSTISNFGYDAVVTYTLQFDKIGNNFSGDHMQQVGMPASGKTSTQIQTSLSVDALNNIAVLLDLKAYEKDSLEVRVQAKISDYYDAAYSAPIKMYITSYRKETYLWVPGDYQGWSPNTAPQLYSPTGNGVHNGFIYWPAGGTFLFKLTSAADWNHTNYGDGGSGKLSTTGDNLKVPAAGFYLITADIANLTWSATATTKWSVTGDAVGGWGDGFDKELTYDIPSKTWKGTVAFTAAGMKFRANDSWTINLGDNGADGSLEFGGGNINVPAAGTYDVILDLNDATHWTYTLTKH